MGVRMTTMTFRCLFRYNITMADVAWVVVAVVCVVGVVSELITWMGSI